MKWFVAMARLILFLAQVSQLAVNGQYAKSLLLMERLDYFFNNICSASDSS
jgi:hypothetical protein